jgi:hypothetical protein
VLTGKIHGSVVGFPGHGNETSGFIKGSKFHDQLNDYQLIKKQSEPWSHAIFS